MGTRPRIKYKGEKVASSNYVSRKREYFTEEIEDERQLKYSIRRDRKRKRHEERNGTKQDREMY